MNDESCDSPGGAHAATIKRMIEQSPPFRPEASDAELVAAFAEGEYRWPAFLALCARGAKILPAVRNGLQDPDWQVRRWCASIADNFADGETLRAMVPLLNDPNPQVRNWAVHSLSCESCKDGPNPIDAVPLLIDRIRLDPSIKVRRQAVAMLAHHRAPDARVLPVFKEVMDQDDDRKLCLHAEEGLKNYAAAGLQ